MPKAIASSKDATLPPVSLSRQDVDFQQTRGIERDEGKVEMEEQKRGERDRGETGKFREKSD